MRSCSPRKLEKLRAFFADVVGMPSVDAGGGWLIFALLRPSWPFIQPMVQAWHELYLMCDNIQATLAELKGKGAEVARDVCDQGWGLSRPSACQTAGVSHLRAPASIAAPNLTDAPVAAVGVRGGRTRFQHWAGQRR